MRMRMRAMSFILEWGVPPSPYPVAKCNGMNILRRGYRQNIVNIGVTGKILSIKDLA
jgi:hypothetical protein